MPTDRWQGKDLLSAKKKIKNLEAYIHYRTVIYKEKKNSESQNLNYNNNCGNDRRGKYDREKYSFEHVPNEHPYCLLQP